MRTKRSVVLVIAFVGFLRDATAMTWLMVFVGSRRSGVDFLLGEPLVRQTGNVLVLVKDRLEALENGHLLPMFGLRFVGVAGRNA